MNSETFFYLEPYVYASIDNKKVLFYNTLSGRYLIQNLNDSEFRTITSTLVHSFSRSVKIDNNMNSTINYMIQQLRSIYCGDIVQGYEPFVEPINAKVLFNKSKFNGNYSKIIDSVKKMTIVSGIGSFTDINVLTDMARFNNDCIVFSDLVKYLSSEIEFPNLYDIEFVGCYQSLNDIKLIVQIFKHAHFSLHINSEDVILEDLKKIRSWCDDFRVIICFDNMIDMDKINRIIEFCHKYEIKLTGCYIVCSETDVELFEHISPAFDYAFMLPKYDNNMSFISKNVFLSSEDILSQKLSEEDILTNMSVNANFFGELYFMPDNNIYANPNYPTLGKLGDDWHDILRNLLDSCWFKIRDMKPCCDCAFQYLCPPPSNYEAVIGKPNLCNIMP